MQKHPLVAVDTNFPLWLAAKREEAIEALGILRARLRPDAIVIPPTAMAELKFQAESGSDARLRRLATTALKQIRAASELRASHLSSTQEGIATEAARRLIFSGLLPASELNDAAIVAEAAVLNAVLLVSNDSHLLRLEPRALGFFFLEMDLPVPLIVSPYDLIRTFCR